MSSLDLLLGAPGAESPSTQQGPPESSESDFFFAPQGQSISFSNALDLILNDGVSDPAQSQQQQQEQLPAPSALNPNDEHLNNENFFDFFETSQQQQQQQQGSQFQPQSQQEQQLLQLVDIGESPEKCDLEMLKEALNLLKTTSHKHNRILIEEGKL